MTDYENDSPEKIISDLQNYRTDRDGAIKRIRLYTDKEVEKRIKQEEYLTEDDMKDFKEYICDLLWDRYNLPQRGNATLIKEIVSQAVKKLCDNIKLEPGESRDFYRIKKKRYSKLKDILWNII